MTSATVAPITPVLASPVKPNDAVLRNPFIRLDRRDNVVVARIPVKKGTLAPDEGIAATQDVPAGHKMATHGIRKGEPVLKYNTVIGFASEDIAPGTWVHSHNIAFDEVVKDYRYGLDYAPVSILPPEERRRFQGIVRADGRVGTRNYVGVFIVSHRAATVARKIAEFFDSEVMQGYANIDGVVPFVHQVGANDELTSERMAMLRRTIGGTIVNPNIAAALIIAFADEDEAELNLLLQEQQIELGPMVRMMIVRGKGGTRRAIEHGVEAVRAMMPTANEVGRQPVSVEHLVVGLQCGGSDGFSGLSANPALGVAMEILIRNGGTAILSETPEIFGVEQVLTARSRTAEVGRKLVSRMNWWLKYNEGRDTQINGQLSPGNNAGGLANVLEKSLGGVKKGGNAPLMEVYEYAERVGQNGLVFMDTPGYDPMSATGQIAGGANMVCFTTGRGSCFGSVPAPTIKLASNTPMFARMEADMDINCGVVIDGEASLQDMGARIFECLLLKASGEATKSEQLGVGQDEFVPWSVGAVT